ncbi:MAG: preprotein translocase subunit SecG [Proteobacteria bacterium]|jgi:preprotein translocase subunit SecG|nr:preprotein translocase subunit SecG [Pseudomonadota bacterium]MDB4827302.1 preprotein translocase subunit SecG [Gammaproteobacteria bacterium]MBT4106768.1 preprotein translocase subunit SecG [Pseudomonadota bacterium]MBT4356499.1 preprotein translocase subunit SecG [Pseudomonadota bacterium]MBT4986282.1 preprotein translocase subunit SecG [Pseudomonadota bacterium]
MNLFTSILTVIHLVTAIAIVVLVLLQQGKGADMGAAFGGGSSQSVFGSRGSANFLSRTTGILAAVFFATGLSLAYMYTKQSSAPTSVMASENAAPVEDQINGAGSGSDVLQSNGDVPVVPGTNSN